MLDTVKDAFEMLKKEQEESGQCDVEIDGMTGFIFCNRFGNVPNPQSVNRAIKRIIADYNATEEVAAKKQHREAVLLPDFSVHHLRHTLHKALRKRNKPESHPIGHGAQGHPNDYGCLR